MPDEFEDLAEALVFTLNLIVSVSDDDRSRIAVAYHEARQLAAGIAFDNGDARPRIVACIERFRLLQTAGNIEAAGWMLTALEERIAERNLPEWRKLRTVAKKAADLLSSRPKRPH